MQNHSAAARLAPCIVALAASAIGCIAPPPFVHDDVPPALQVPAGEGSVAALRRTDEAMAATPPLARAAAEQPAAR
jgi:hypothetical protein